MFALPFGQHHGAGDAIQHIGGGRTAPALLSQVYQWRSLLARWRHFLAPKSRVRRRCSAKSRTPSDRASRGDPSAHAPNLPPPPDTYSRRITTSLHC